MIISYIAFFQHLINILLRRAVVMVVDLGMFQEGIFCQELLEPRVIGKIIIGTAFSNIM